MAEKLFCNLLYKDVFSRNSIGTWRKFPSIKLPGSQSPWGEGWVVTPRASEGVNPQPQVPRVKGQRPGDPPPKHEQT